MKVSVVGHVEWVQFLRVKELPRAGDIVRATDFWEEVAGGGPGAAVQLMKLAGAASLFTSLGGDETGAAAVSRLSEMGLSLFNDGRSNEPTRRAVTFVDEVGERTITVIGRRLEPRGEGPLPWDELDEVDACYFTAGDSEALKMARRARVLVATARVLPLLASTGVRLDALVGSANDPAETYRHGDLDPVPDLVVLTDGDRGGSYSERGEAWQRYPPQPLDAPVVDRYGAGDSFAGALAFALAAGFGPRQATELASRCGAAVLRGRGPYETQLARADVADLLPTHL